MFQGDLMTFSPVFRILGGKLGVPLGASAGGLPPIKPSVIAHSG